MKSRMRPLHRTTRKKMNSQRRLCHSLRGATFTQRGGSRNFQKGVCVGGGALAARINIKKSKFCLKIGGGGRPCPAP